MQTRKCVVINEEELTVAIQEELEEHFAGLFQSLRDEIDQALDIPPPEAPNGPAALRNCSNGG